jgi:hypothetical protein
MELNARLARPDPQHVENPQFALEISTLNCEDAFRTFNKVMFDYTKDLRRLLADGNTLDQSLAALRAKGASIIGCIYAVRKFRDCDLAEAKQMVHFSPAWADRREEHDKFHAEMMEEIAKKIDETGGAGNEL